MKYKRHSFPTLKETTLIQRSVAHAIIKNYWSVTLRLNQLYVLAYWLPLDVTGLCLTYTVTETGGKMREMVMLMRADGLRPETKGSIQISFD